MYSINNDFIQSKQFKTCAIDILHRYSIDATKVQKKFQQEDIKSLPAAFTSLQRIEGKLLN